MKMRNIALCAFLCAFLLLTLAAGSISAQEESGAGMKNILRACETARNSFLLQLESDKSYEWEHKKYTTDIANYSMGISEIENSYFVFFRLNNYKNIRGGGTLYVIEKKTFRIVRVAKYK